MRFRLGPLGMRALDEVDHSVEKLSPGSAVARINNLSEITRVPAGRVENTSVPGSFSTGAIRR